MTIQTSYNLLATNQDINTAHDFCPKTGNYVTPTLWERSSQLLSHGPGSSSSVTSTSGTGPTNPSSILFVSISGSAHRGYSETSLFHLHISFNGTAAPPGSPILDDRQTENGRMSALLRRWENVQYEYWDSGFLGERERESAEKSKDYGT